MCESHKHKLAQKQQQQQQQQHRRQQQRVHNFFCNSAPPFFFGFARTSCPHTYTNKHKHTCIRFAFLGFTASGWVFIVIIFYLARAAPSTSSGYNRRRLLGIKSKVQMFCGQFGFEVGQQRDAKSS